MICKHCSEEIDDNAKFCPYCGTKVEETETPVSIETEKMETEEENTVEEESTVTEENHENTEETKEEEESVKENIPEETEETKEEESQQTKAEEPVEEKPKQTVIDSEVVEENTEKKQENNTEKDKKFEMPEVDISMFKVLGSLVKNPFQKADVRWPVAVCCGILSILVNSLMMYTIMYQLARSLYGVYAIFGYGSIDIGNTLAQLGYTTGSFLTGGFLFTLVVFVAFMIIEFVNEEKSLDGLTRSMGSAAALLFVPTLMNLIAILGFNIHVYFGAFFLILSFVTELLVVNARLSEKLNPYLRIVILAALGICILSTFGAVILG